MYKAEWFLLFLVALSFATGAAFYSHVPALIASHWNMAGQVNGYMSRAWGIFIFPVVFLVIFLLLYFIPRIDPKRENILRFRKYFDYFLVGFSIVFFYIYFITLLWNVGYHFNLTAFIIPPLAALFYLVGVLLPHTEPNWSIGIRTPWTISSETVWMKTHKAGGTAFKIAAVIGLLGTAFPAYGIWFLIVPLIVAIAWLVIYSYLLYEREKHPK